MGRRVWIALGLGVLAAAGCQKKTETVTPAPATAAAPATPQMTPPARRPGLWEQRVSNGDYVQVTRICLDAAVDAKLSWWGQQATQDICQKNLFTHRPDGAWAVSSVCDMGTGGKVTTAGTATGDFASKYQLRAESSTVGAAAPQMNGVHRFVIDAAWMGACPAGMQPGDMTLPGGVRINLLGK
ncbi:MAG: hypothetical protein E7812_04620 [Phenylobacterium sp.]|nr:MAG: hypothetical protein E7812_04620 [Phenylobacterium sp.]